MTVVVPVRNEAANIRACLESLDAQTFKDFEVLVVDGASTDATIPTALQLSAERPAPPIRVVRNPKQTIPHALNRAADEARGAFLVRVDGHSTVNQTYLETIVRHLGSGAWAGVGGRKIATGTTRTGRAFRIAFASRAGAGRSLYHHGTQAAEVEHIPFGAYPRYVVQAIGGWDEDLLVNQDYEFDHRIRLHQGRLLFDPDLVVHWRARESIRDVAYQYHRYGAGKAVVVRKHVRSLRPRQVAPPALVLGASTMAITACATRAWRPLVPYAGYGVGTAIAGIRAARRAGADRRTAATVPLVLSVMHHAWGFGFLRGLVRGLVGGRCADPFRRNPATESVVRRPRLIADRTPGRSTWTTGVRQSRGRGTRAMARPSSSG